MPAEPTRPPLTALVVFVAILGAWLGWAARPVDVARAPTDKGRAFDATLARAAPSVVVLGNSITHVGLDHDAVAEALGAADHYAALTLDGSTGLYWYAVLRNHVYGGGLAPEVVLIPSTAGWLLKNQPPSTATRQELAAEIAPDDTELLAKLHGGVALPPPVQRFLDRRATPRDALLERAKAWAVGLVFVDPRTVNAPLPEAGLALADEALARVFADEGALDLSLHTNAMPIVEIDPAARRRPAPLDLAGSIVPELLALTEAHGTRLLFVEMPVRRPIHPVSAEAREALIEAFNEADHAAWIDLSAVPVEPGDFADMVHLNALGRPKVTAALVERLRRIDLSGELPDALPPLRPTRAARTEATPLLVETGPSDVAPCCTTLSAEGLTAHSALRLSKLALRSAPPLRVRQGGLDLPTDASFADLRTCERPGARHHTDKVIACSPDGAPSTLAWSPFPAPQADGSDAWWVPPGTTATLELPALGEPGELVLRTLRLGRGDPTLRVGGEVVPWQARGLRFDATVPVHGARPTVLELSMPPDGAVLWIDVLAARHGDLVRPVIGAATQLGDKALDLVQSKGPGELVVDQPPVVLPPDGPVQDRAPFRLVPSARAGALSDLARVGRMVMRSCAPVQLLRDGAPVPGANTGKVALREGAAGWLAVPDGALLGPAEADGAFAFGLVTDLPDCRNSQWLHEGGTATWTLDGLDALYGDARSVRVRAQAFGPGVRALEVVVRVGGDEVLRAPVDALDGDRVDLPLAPPVPFWKRDVSVSVSLPEGAASVLLTDVMLTEAEVAP